MEGPEVFSRKQHWELFVSKHLPFFKFGAKSGVGRITSSWYNNVMILIYQKGTREREKRKEKRLEFLVFTEMSGCRYPTISAGQIPNLLSLFFFLFLCFSRESLTQMPIYHSQKAGSG